ncbi:YraN family protein [Egicoccus sp. AB-alg6-2]|uniref:YraN family protein n=1 Tax=Egicoccus sp. AB-alg6-2 TaxID=3242692 RepID=UPI00359E888C
MDTNGHCTRPLPRTEFDGGTRTIGRLGEDLAAHHLQVDDGLEVVARNWRLTTGELRGELDVVAVDRHSGTVVICEVKTRRDAQRFGGALEAVSPRKRAKLRALAGAFLRQSALGLPHARLDLIAIDLGRRPVLHHVRDAL